LKIGPHLPKLLPNIQGAYFFEAQYILSRISVADDRVRDVCERARWTSVAVYE